MEEASKPAALALPSDMATLAAALGQLTRSPGRDEAWVEHALTALERSHAHQHRRLRRRLGFAQRLADLAQLRVDEQAVLLGGLFCHELLSEPPLKRASSGAWIDYLTRNQHWLAPCLRVCQALPADWQEIDGRAAAVAKLVVTFDTETVERHNRPLQVLQDLISTAEGPAIDPIGPFLWSEEGQALCDFHFRRHADGYRLDANEMRHTIQLLRHMLPPPPAFAPVEPAQADVAQAPVAQHKASAKATEIASSDSFQRRREALRANRGALLGDHTSEVPVRQRDGELPGQRDMDAVTPDPTFAATPNQPAFIEAMPAQEELMEKIQSISSARMTADPGLELVERLDALRSQLEQIRRIAAEGQQLLADLAPQVDQFASWIVELETVVGRWKARERAA